jgi:hypothetical protein
MNTELIFVLFASLFIFTLIFFGTFKAVNFYRKKYIIEIKNKLSKYKEILAIQEDIKVETYVIGTFHRRKARLGFNSCEILVTKDALIIFGKRTFAFDRLTEAIVLTFNTNEYAELLPAKNVFKPSFARILKLDKSELESGDNSVYIETTVKNISENYLFKIRLYSVNENIKNSLKLTYS